MLINDLFSDFFARRDNFFSRIDPRTKMIITLSAIFASLLSSSVIVPLSIFLFSICAILAIRIPVRLVFFRLAAPFGVVLVIFLLKTFMTGNTPVYSFSLAGFEFIAKKEGLLQGILIASRVLGTVSIIMFMSFVTPAYKIFHSLYWFKISKEWVEVALLMYRYIFALIEQASDITSAQKMRLGYSGIKPSVNSLGILAGTLIVGSIDQSMRTHNAMIMRGYNDTFSFAPLQKMKFLDKLILVFTPIVIFVFSFWVNNRF